MTDSLFGDLYNPPLAEDAAETFGVPASSPRAVGAGQTGRTVTVPKVAATSLEAYRDLQASLPAREAAVLVGLRRYKAVHGRWPTAYELFEAMRAEGYAFDLNSVRPRLTGLWKKSKVQQQARRRCRITGKSAYTWAIENQEA